MQFFLEILFTGKLVISYKFINGYLKPAPRFPARALSRYVQGGSAMITLNLFFGSFKLSPSMFGRLLAPPRNTYCTSVQQTKTVACCLVSALYIYRKLDISSLIISDSMCAKNFSIFSAFSSR